ncbi:FAD-binding oxidoreductase [Salinigranum salinum]|uniref:FAD-binding oxidoreductase n=1 Tax=Salinigranum salinum TaxID=1364937 RepID=UPI001260592C|nr:FAD-binding oxidoreductase [Salinigranum salinum]
MSTPSPELLAALDLRDDQYSTTEADRDDHSRDWATAPREAVAPDVVVWPESTGDVSAVLAAATEHGVPVTPFAAATGLEGNAVPVHGGVSLDMTRMDSVLEIRPEDRQIDVEPGLLGSEINEALERYGLFFPPLPTSGDIATIGGMLATNASGKQTVKYGKVGDWVMELEVVLADGSVVEVGTRATKTSSGYNLRDLIVGSEGTLAVVTRATLALAGRPEQQRAGRVVFDSFETAATAAADIVRSGVDVAALELIDSLAAAMANAYLDGTLPEKPMAFLEFHANHGVDEEIDFCRTILDRYDPLDVEFGDGSAQDDLWEARRELADATRAYYSDRESTAPGDLAVPLSRYPDLVEYIHALSDERDLPIPCFGHAGDGNIHFDVFADPADEEEWARGVETYETIVREAVRMGGTATGEHGVGRGKRKFMLDEHGESGVRAMRAIKDALDPDGILNPGKILPDVADGR